MNPEEKYPILGQIVWTYLGLQYGVTLLGNKLAPGLVGQGDIRTLGSVAHDLRILSFGHNYPDLNSVAQDFETLTETFKGLLETTPFSADGGDQEIGSSELDTKWPLAKLTELANEIASLQSRVTQVSATIN